MNTGTKAEQENKVRDAQGNETPIEDAVDKTKDMKPLPTPAPPAKNNCAPSFLMEQRGEMDPLCGVTPAEKKVEYVESEEEKEAGGEA
jgi:hypothetical protein